MQIKVITLNVWNGGTLFDSVVSFLKKEDPDLLALQEVYNGHDPNLAANFRTIEQLKKKLSLPFYAFSPAYLHILEVGRIEQGNTIFSKFPIKREQTTFYDILYKDRLGEGGPKVYALISRNLQHAQIEVGEKELNVFNTQGIWGYDGKDNPRRLKMAQTIIKYIQGKKNVILCGDSNVDQHTQTMRNLEEYLTNVFKGELTTTFNLKRKTKGDYARAVVDMMLVSPNIRVLDHYCPDVDISDHLPLVANLEI